MEWQKINHDTLNQPRKETMRGVDFHVYFTSDDMPLGVRGDYDKKRKRFIMEFRYIHEPSKLMPVKFDQHVVLKIDKSSQRLFAVEIDVDALNVEKVRLLGNIANVLDQIPTRGKELGVNRTENYIATSNAFKQVKNKLATAMQ